MDILNDKDMSVGAVGGDLIEPAKPASLAHINLLDPDAYKKAGVPDWGQAQAAISEERQKP